MTLQVVLERDWLAARARKASRIHLCGGHYTSHDGRDTGVSSNALVRIALGGAAPEDREFPYDVHDLAACFRAHHGAPRHLRVRMLTTLARYVDRVRARSPQEVGELLTAVESWPFACP